MTLALQRQVGTKIIIDCGDGKHITFDVVNIRNKCGSLQATIGVDAPAEYGVFRSELLLDPALKLSSPGEQATKLIKRERNEDWTCGICNKQYTGPIYAVATMHGSLKPFCEACCNSEKEKEGV